MNSAESWDHFFILFWKWDQWLIFLWKKRFKPRSFLYIFVYIYRTRFTNLAPFWNSPGELQEEVASNNDEKSKTVVHVQLLTRNQFILFYNMYFIISHILCLHQRNKDNYTRFRAFSSFNSDALWPLCALGTVVMDYMLTHFESKSFTKERWKVKRYWINLAIWDQKDGKDETWTSYI